MSGHDAKYFRKRRRSQGVLSVNLFLPLSTSNED